MRIIFQILTFTLYFWHFQSFSYAQNIINKCSICLEPLPATFSIDAWNNPFHTYHEKEGIFCNSCSRIISEAVTQGGFSYSDGRHICTLCQATVVENEINIKKSYESVIEQLYAIGIKNISKKIPIKLINLIEFNKITKINNHGNLKGYTKFNNTNMANKFEIFILFGLPKVEFEAALAHELLHIWLEQNNFHLKSEITEGFCNLGRALIYENENTYFSKIHLNSMQTDTSLIYGSGYRKMNLIKKELGWHELINNFKKIK